MHFHICCFYIDCGGWWLELDSDSCWTFHSNGFEYDAAKKNCEERYYGKLLELDENVPDILKNVYDSDTAPAWVANKVNFKDFNKRHLFVVGRICLLELLGLTEKQMTSPSNSKRKIVS